jgi:hypothetical protein
MEKLNQDSKTRMGQDDAARIKSTQVHLSNYQPRLVLTRLYQAKGGKETGAGTFESRAQGAGDRNANEAANQGGQKK